MTSLERVVDDLDFGAWAARLARIPAVRIEVPFAAERPVQLDEALNVRVRGLWVAELRRFFCETLAPTCDGCDWLAVCGYGRWIKADSGRQLYWLAGVPATERLEPGQYRARVTVVGEAAPAARVFADGLVRALHRVRGDDDRAVIEPSSEPVVRPISLAGEPVRALRWRLDLHTPVVRKDGAASHPEACPAAPWLNPLVYATVGRVRGLLTELAGEDTSAWPLQPDLRGVRCSEQSMQAAHFEYGRRGHDAAITVDGWRGHAVLEGEAMRVVGPLLAAGAEIGVGKKTTFGFGHISATPLPG